MTDTQKDAPENLSRRRVFKSAAALGAGVALAGATQAAAQAQTNAPRRFSEKTSSSPARRRASAR